MTLRRMTFYIRRVFDPPGKGVVVSVHAEDRATALDMLIDDYHAEEYWDLPEGTTHE